MKKLIIALAVMASFGAQANRCDYPDQIAKDGSLCGARAASVRPGGYTPPPEYSAPVQQQERQIEIIPELHYHSHVGGDNNYDFIKVGADYQLKGLYNDPEIETFYHTNTKNVYCRKPNWRDQTDCIKVISSTQVDEYLRDGKRSPDFNDTDYLTHYVRGV
ncbi:hypothetical protein [Klebsiella pneumoniae]|uniref:hypothetical protein n=1 Tax=Klebsiella pneumoniae TaxID=573 RepID=UPI000B9BF9B2|nr:hypothetical protein [Klebsiella pneumoniae]HBQ5991066.1 hypothetical protein [Klebsiella pneumoniae subsp. pneumoniae]HBR6772831.1 hypothetical protein [Klebsiella pneumoniae]